MRNMFNKKIYIPIIALLLVISTVGIKIGLGENSKRLVEDKIVNEQAKLEESKSEKSKKAKTKSKSKKAKESKKKSENIDENEDIQTNENSENLENKENLAKEILQNKETSKNSEVEVSVESDIEEKKGAKEENQKLKSITNNQSIDNNIVEEKKLDTVNISISSDSKSIVSLETIDLSSEETVFDILKKLTNNKKIHIDYSGSGSTAYIKAIDNIYEKDMGPESGWMYTVNGKFPGKSCGSYTLKSGDKVEWLYSKNLGKDLEHSL